MYTPINLKQEHLEGCQVLCDRVLMLERIMPKSGVVAEVGVQAGDYSRLILDINKPSKLHLLEIDPVSTISLEDRFKEEIKSGKVEVHLGDSSALLSRFNKGTFDWVWIDGDHSYNGVRKDLEQARLKVKDNGFIGLHDYVNFSPMEEIYYGVVNAVNQFCNEHGYRVVCMSVEPHMYNTIVLQKIDGPNKGRYPIQLCDFFLNDQQYEDALRVANLAIELEKDKSSAYWRKGKALSFMDRYSEAGVQFNTAISLSNDTDSEEYGWLMYDAGRNDHWSNNKTEAHKKLTIALDIIKRSAHDKQNIVTDAIAELDK